MQNRLSRIFTVSICALGIFGASALQAQDPVTLDFYFLSDSVTGPYVEQIITDFETANPTIDINLLSYPNESYKTAIQVAIGADDAPDLLFNWPGEDTGRFVREGHLLDLAPYAEEFGWSDTVSPAALDAYTFDGALYGAPYSLEAKYYYYNTAIFEAQGLSVPTTFEELLGVCQALRAADITPMSFGNQERWEGVHYMSILNQRMAGEDTIAGDYTLTTPADALFTNPGYVAAFEKLLELQNAGCFADAVNSTTPDAAQAQFYTEQVAMYYQGTWIIGQLDANEFAGRYGMFRMPPITSDDAQGNQNYALLGPIGLQVSARSEHPDEAAAFLNYFIGQTAQQGLVGDLQRIPVRADAVSSDNASPQLIFVVEDLNETAGAVLWLDVILENRVSEAYLNGIQEVLAGTLTPEQAVAAIREQALAVQLERAS
ncbi:MAG: extracellular solute-binding protein [Chloroflexota bacterium]|nr:extracellular solute-binding protein [Chloroflexota bacterium]